MIVDLQRFIATERPFWNELEKIARPAAKPSRMRGCRWSNCSCFITFTNAPPPTWRRSRRFPPSRKPAGTWKIWSRAPMAKSMKPAKSSGAFSAWNGFSRRCRRLFAGTCAHFISPSAITIAGCVFGGLAIAFDPDAKPVLMPFSPSAAGSGQAGGGGGEDRQRSACRALKTTFSAELMTHNTKVAIFTLALGMTWGIGTMLMLFYNGVILGAVAVDYIRAGEIKFLLGWLMPHGVIEIPAILIAGQAGLMLALAHHWPRQPAAAKNALARNCPGRGHADFRRGLASDLGGICRSFFVAIPSSRSFPMTPKLRLAALN